jgi:hypothetical protein
MDPAQRLYTIRINGHLGPIALSAFPTMIAWQKGKETVLTGFLQDRSAVFGVLAQIEALGLELTELRRVLPRPRYPGSGDDSSLDVSSGW